MLLNMSMMRKLAKSAVGRGAGEKIKLHPLLKETKVSVATKTAYINGCVLASVIHDEEPSRMALDTVRRIALSLRMTAGDVDDCLDVVKALSNDKEKLSFVDETFKLLKVEIVRRYFMSDFKNVLNCTGPIAGEILEFYNYVGMILFKTEDWRERMSEEWREQKRNNAKSFKKHRRETEPEDDSGCERNPPEWWDPLPVQSEGESDRDFARRVTNMVKRRITDIHEKFRRGDIDEDEATNLMIRADIVKHKVDPYYRNSSL